MAGLLAARVLAESYRTVTVVDRDELPLDPVSRRGVPQGRHQHALLARGAQILEELFPGVLAELAADGAPVWDDGDLSRFYMRINGHLMHRTGQAADFDPAAHSVYLPSRPFLEGHVRQRVRAIENVTLLARREVTALTVSDDRRCVTGVQLADRGTGESYRLPADLVVDATGRGSRTPVFLQELGYGRPAEDHVTTHTTYVSQGLRLRPGALHELLIAITPRPNRPTGMFLTRNENDVWMLTAFGLVGREPPCHRGGMLDFVAPFVPARYLAAVQSGEPVTPAVRHKLPSSQWRRYDRMRRLPEGLLVCGDAICSFNPIYGQGMTVAALEALALRESLRCGTTQLGSRYFRAAAASIKPAWRMSTGSDLAIPDVRGRRSPGMRLSTRFTEWVLTAAESDSVVAQQFSRVTGLIDPPARLCHPRVVSRVAVINRRGDIRPVGEIGDQARIAPAIGAKDIVR